MSRPRHEAPPDAPSPQSTVYYDGACALCRAEIGLYSRSDPAGALCFVDVSRDDAAVPADLTRRDAMARLHVRAADGRMTSGAAAFVELWARLPGWRWAARVARLPGATAALEIAYRAFLPVRPVISRLFGKLRNGGSGPRV